MFPRTVRLPAAKQVCEAINKRARPRFYLQHIVSKRPYLTFWEAADRKHEHNEEGSP